MCVQQMEIYTCTYEIAAVGVDDHQSVLCGCSIAEKGKEGRYVVMPGDPHRVHEFPVYCEVAERTGRAGINCPQFKLERIYTPDPENRPCHLHGGRDPQTPQQTGAELERERRRQSQDFSRESQRARAAYMENNSLPESRPSRARERLSVAPRDRGESPWAAHSGAGGTWLPEPEDAETLRARWSRGFSDST